MDMTLETSRRFVEVLASDAHAPAAAARLRWLAPSARRWAIWSAL